MTAHLAMDLYTSEFVFLACTAPLLLFCFYRALCAVSRFEVLSAIGSVARDVILYMSKRQGFAEIGPLDLYVVRRMNLKQQEAMISSIAIGCWVLPSVLSVTFFNVLTQMTYWHSFEQDCLICIVTWLAIFVQHCLDVRSPRAVYFLHGLTMLFSAFWVQLSDATPGMVLWSVVSVTLVRLAMSLTYVNVGTIIFWNFSCSLADCFKYAAADIGPPAVNVDLYVFLLLEATLCVLAGSISARLRADAFKQCRLEGVHSSQDLEHSASRVLLEHYCEVIVPLDSNYHITSDAKSLAAMLSLDASGSMMSMDIQQLMTSDSDRADFRDAFSSNGAEPASKVSSVNVCMRDGNGSDLQFEFVGVVFSDLDDTNRYLMGVREFSDADSVPVGALGQMHVKSAKKRLYKGTPPTHVSESFAGDLQEIDEDEGDDRSDSSIGIPILATRCLAVPDRLVTPLHTKIRSLIRVIASWNIRTHRAACCSFHACLPEIKLVLEKLARAPCQPDFHDVWSDQCRKCAMLNSLDDDNKCASCGFVNERTES
eukprot:TRINITY_DN12099_c0_g1_i1.p1 TRINITY_DN12099_c0_g1~~TRINITY_DN12099_c0_g1_i1.p1  ORF type:complete len:539 (-),score=69.19 TRINITY_DN12099_c0_g1_i1:424-2040(-)